MKALADYERKRNEAAMPEYELNYQLASLQPQHPKMQRLYAALVGNEAETDRFIGTLMGTVPIAEFYAPENIARIVGLGPAGEQSARAVRECGQTVPSELVSRFTAAVSGVQRLSRRPDNASLLKLYALYKQSTSGDVVGTRPGVVNFVARAKFDAWATLRGTPQEVAMEEYIDLAERLRLSS